MSELPTKKSFFGFKLKNPLATIRKLTTEIRRRMWLGTLAGVASSIRGTPEDETVKKLCTLLRIDSPDGKALAFPFHTHSTFWGGKLSVYQEIREILYCHCDEVAHEHGRRVVYASPDWLKYADVEKMVRDLLRLIGPTGGLFR